jgi:hypothetical protein
VSALKNLIIGKNSKIVLELRDQLENFDFISHTEIGHVNFSSYEAVFLFSWSSKRLKQNLSLLSMIPMEKLVFISTIAVASNAIRDQWSAYPKWKLACENYVLDKGGRVIRIGIWCPKIINRLSGIVPVTTKSDLVNLLNKSLSKETSVISCVDLLPGRKVKFVDRFGMIVNKLARLLPSQPLYQVPLIALHKLIGSVDYGYTADCRMLFSDRFLVGYGAVGSVVYKSLNDNGIKCGIFVSNRADAILTDKNFKGFRIGYDKTGLAKFWHGVKIVKHKGEWKKYVPFFVKRPHLPLTALKFHVEGLDFGESLVSIKLASDRVRALQGLTRKVHLAAGSIQNAQILGNGHDVRAIFSDHEIFNAGTIDTQHLIEKEFLKKKWVFVYGRKVYRSSENPVEFMFDVRPKAPDGLMLDATHIYNNRSSQIFKKLIKLGCPALVNQAMFNKFGICFYTSSFSVFVQAVSMDCILVDKGIIQSRKRLKDSALKSIIREIEKLFPVGFAPNADPNTFDAIHAVGQLDLSCDQTVRTAIEREQLSIHGFSIAKLTAFHHTAALLVKEQEILDEK